MWERKALTSPMDSDGSLDSSGGILIRGMRDNKAQFVQLHLGFVGHSPPASRCVPQHAVACSLSRQGL
eukprot:9959939-Prorocentrum_lima.AAC.1